MLKTTASGKYLHHFIWKFCGGSCVDRTHHTHYQWNNGAKKSMEGNAKNCSYFFFRRLLGNATQPHIDEKNIFPNWDSDSAPEMNHINLVTQQKRRSFLFIEYCIRTCNIHIKKSIMRYIMALFYSHSWHLSLSYTLYLAFAPSFQRSPKSSMAYRPYFSECTGKWYGATYSIKYNVYVSRHRITV